MLAVAVWSVMIVITTCAWLVLWYVGFSGDCLALFLVDCMLTSSCALDILARFHLCGRS